MAGDPIDSSDQEFSDVEADTRYAHLGLASIERMRDNQLESECSPPTNKGAACLPAPSS